MNQVTQVPQAKMKIFILFSLLWEAIDGFKSIKCAMNEAE